ncbi:MAG: hypothetical protein K8S99_09160 [Planctomycetes bacterium]|nr:hypothetical protein [Planctomycetota bacterium]
MSILRLRHLLVGLLLLLAASGARGNETDQFTLPERESFADLGEYMSRTHYEVLSRVVSDANHRIAEVLKNSDDEKERAEELADARSPGRLADAVRETFGPAMFEIDGLEQLLYSKEFKSQYPGKITAYKTDNWIYADALLILDPRRLLFLQNPSSTIRVYGVFMGTDKIGHFHDLGHLYYKDYLGYVRDGDTDQKACAKIVSEYSKGVVSEKGIVGSVVSGVYSNADLACNYAGMRFYQNLTEPVRINGVERPPLIVRNGDFLKLNDHVKPDKPWFGVFVSDHFNEALNPCLHDWMMRGSVRDRVRKNKAAILRFYADPSGQPYPREHFETLARELSTFYGEPYGHSGFNGHLVGVYNVCFEK